jgi:hypothetical protein
MKPIVYIKILGQFMHHTRDWHMKLNADHIKTYKLKSEIFFDLINIEYRNFNVRINVQLS